MKDMVESEIRSVDFFRSMLVKYNVNEEDVESCLLEKCRGGEFDEEGMERVARITNMNIQLKKNGMEPLYVSNALSSVVSSPITADPNCAPCLDPCKRLISFSVDVSRSKIREKYIERAVQEIADIEKEKVLKHGLNLHEYVCIKGNHGKLFGSIDVDYSTFTRLISICKKFEKKLLQNRTGSDIHYVLYKYATNKLKNIACQKLRRPERLRLVQEAFKKEEGLSEVQEYQILKKFSAVVPTEERD